MYRVLKINFQWSLKYITEYSGHNHSEYALPISYSSLTLSMIISTSNSSNHASWKEFTLSSYRTCVCSYGDATVIDNVYHLFIGI